MYLLRIKTETGYILAEYPRLYDVCEAIEEAENLIVNASKLNNCEIVITMGEE